jgi:hypothetical protein
MCVAFSAGSNQPERCALCAWAKYVWDLGVIHDSRGHNAPSLRKYSSLFVSEL